MDVASTTISVISLAIQLHDRFQSSTRVFHELRVELENFQCLHGLASESSQRHSELLILQTGCAKVICDIEKQLEDYDEDDPSFLQRLRASFTNVEQLRIRLTRHSSMLSACASLILLRQQSSYGQAVPPNAAIQPLPSTPTLESHEDVRAYVETTLRKYNPSESQIDRDALIMTMMEIWSSFQGPDADSRPTTLSSQPSSSVVSLEASQSTGGRLTPSSRNSVSQASVSTSSSTRSTQSRKTISSLVTTINPRYYAKEFLAAVKNGNITKRDKLRCRVDEKVLDEALLLVTKDSTVQCNRLSMARYLLSTGASRLHTDAEKDDRTLVIWATITARLDLVHLYLDADKSISLELLNKKDSRDNLTPLIWAIRLGRNAIVDYLIDRGADLEAGDWVLQRTPLHWAAMVGNFHAAGSLLRKDPQLIDMPDIKGLTPAVFAYPLLVNTLNHDRQDLARLFIEKGGPLESQDPRDSSILVIAAQKGQFDIIQTIMRRQGADMRLQSVEPERTFTENPWCQD